MFSLRESRSAQQKVTTKIDIYLVRILLIKAFSTSKRSKQKLLVSIFHFNYDNESGLDDRCCW